MNKTTITLSKHLTTTVFPYWNKQQITEGKSIPKYKYLLECYQVGQNITGPIHESPTFYKKGDVISVDKKYRDNLKHDYQKYKAKYHSLLTFREYIEHRILLGAKKLATLQPQEA